MSKGRVEGDEQNGRMDVEMDDGRTVWKDVTPVKSRHVLGAGDQEEVTGKDEESDVVVLASTRRSKRPRAASSDKAGDATPRADMCKACGVADSRDPDVLMHCKECQVAVHMTCYGLAPSEAGARAEWICDVCALPTSVEGSLRLCVFCTQEVDAAYMRRVQTADWPALYRKSSCNEDTWGHLACALWDPFHRSSANVVRDHAVSATETATDIADVQELQSSDKDKATGVTPATGYEDPFASRLELFVPPCSVCDSSSGIRVQCRHLHCGRFFHVRCVHSTGKGVVQLVKNPFLLKRLFCDRHVSAEYNLGSLLTKLTSKTMAGMAPRDVITKLQATARRVETFASVNDVFVDIAATLTELCQKGLKASKTDPPTYSIRHLQALQLLLDHLPQLRAVYDVSTLSLTEKDLIKDGDLLHVLNKLFAPQRYVRKFGGPLSQFLQCDMCHEPFQERQHVFYCTSSKRPHALHWRCTKRKANAKDSRNGSSSAKKKLKSVALVQHGQWKDVKLPKGFPSVSDGVACGVCRAPVDARAVLAGRKEATRMEFEKPSSEFMFGGCFANEMDARSAASAGLQTSRTSMAAAVAAQKAAAAAASSSSASKPTSKRGQVGASGTEQDADTPVILAPPKMERINVRRTTRWLACLGQVIKLVLAAKKAEKGMGGESQGDGASPGENESPSKEATSVDEGVRAETESREIEDNSAGNDNKTTEESSYATESVAAATTSAEMTEEATAAGDLTEEKVAAPHETEHEARLIHPSSTSTMPPMALAYLEEAKTIVRPFDAYALHTMEKAQRMIEESNGPGLSVLSTLIQEYTRFMYIKHTRAVAKASNEKRKRMEQEAQEERERERKRIDREAEMALKKQMLAMRKKQRQ